MAIDKTKKPTFQVGNTMVSEREFKAVSGKGSQGLVLTPGEQNKVQQVKAETEQRRQALTSGFKGTPEELQAKGQELQTAAQGKAFQPLKIGEVPPGQTFQQRVAEELGVQGGQGVPEIRASKAIGVGLANAPEFTADIFQHLKKRFGLGELSDVKDARNQWNQATEVFKGQLDAVKQGADPNDALKALYSMKSANIQLRANVHKDGVKNPFVWQDKGLELEEEAYLNEIQLNAMLDQLNLAAQQGSIATSLTTPLKGGSNNGQPTTPAQ